MTRAFLLLTSVVALIAPLARGASPLGSPGEIGACFVRDGRLLRATDDLVRRDRAIPVETVPAGETVHEFLGVLPGNRLLVSIGEPTLLGSLIHERGVDIVVIEAGGAIESVVARNAVRAYPSPDGSKIVAIGIDYSLFVDENGSWRPVPIPGRAVLAAWSPDGEKLCVTAYPEDWSPHRLTNPDSPEEFLRLLNSDLYLVDVAAGSVERLTDHSASDYGAVFSPDGWQLMFISTRCGHHAFHLMDLATRDVRQLTNRDRYEVPIARSDTITWIEAGDRIVYESQEDMTTNGIRALRADGTEPRLLGAGRQPRVTADGGCVLYLGDDGLVRSVEVGP